MYWWSENRYQWRFLAWAIWAAARGSIFSWHVGGGTSTWKKIIICAAKRFSIIYHNAAARLVFNEPKRAHVTPIFVSLHWLPVAARIQFKTLMLAYKTTTGSAPTYFHSPLRIYIPSWSLISASEQRLVVPSQRGSKSLSRIFSFTVPGWKKKILYIFIFLFTFLSFPC